MGERESKAEESGRCLAYERSTRGAADRRGEEERRRGGKEELARDLHCSESSKRREFQGVDVAVADLQDTGALFFPFE